LIKLGKAIQGDFKRKEFMYIFAAKSHRFGVICAAGITREVIGCKTSVDVTGGRRPAIASSESTGASLRKLLQRS